MKNYNIEEHLSEFEVSDKDLELLEHLGNLHQELDQDQDLFLDLDLES